MFACTASCPARTVSTNLKFLETSRRVLNLDEFSEEFEANHPAVALAVLALFFSRSPLRARVHSGWRVSFQRRGFSVSIFGISLCGVLCELGRCSRGDCALKAAVCLVYFFLVINNCTCL